MRRARTTFGSRWLPAAASLLPLSLALGCAATGDPAGPGDEPSSEREAAVEDGERHTLWVHGRMTSGTAVGDYENFSAFGPADTPAGVNKRAVNWGGYDHISSSNEAVRNALDCFCTGERWCYLVGYSAGNPQIGYALDLHGGTEREVTDGVPDASGRCKATGAAQTGWNVKWVDIAGGAGGGTELADLGYWAASDPLTDDLRTATVRSLYDHNNTQGAVFYMFAGAAGTLYSGILPGQDDEVISYHSSGGLSGTGKFCNPGNWLCDDSLKYDTAGSKRGGATVQKWSHHSVLFRDDGEDHDHYSDGAWSGIVGVARQDAVDYAY